MKKKAKISTIVVSSVVGAIALTVLILCLIMVRPLNTFTSNFDEVNFIYSGTSKTPSIVADANAKKLFDEGVKKSGFNVMQGILEGQFDYSPRFKTEKNEDGDKERVKVYGKEIAALTTADNSTKYVLEFDYGTVKETKIEKETVKYDRVRMEVKSTGGEIHELTVYPYIFEMTVGVSPEVEDYQINPIVIKANLSPLFNALGEIKAHYKIK